MATKKSNKANKSTAKTSTIGADVGEMVSDIRWGNVALYSGLAIGGFFLLRRMGFMGRVQSMVSDAAEMVQGLTGQESESTNATGAAYSSRRLDTKDSSLSY